MYQLVLKKIHTRQIDVQLVIHLVVAGIVDILELSGAVDIDFRHLEAAETAGRLCLEGDRARQTGNQQ